MKFLCFALSLFLSTSAFASSDCKEIPHTKQQCSFDIPIIEDGSASVVKSLENDFFAGSVAVACRNGQLTIGKSNCAPKNPADCAVTESTWFGDDGAVCKHDYQSQIIKDGGLMRVESQGALGHINYSCNNGNTSIKSMSCGAQLKGEEGSAINKSASLETQSLTESKTFGIKLNFESSSYTTSKNAAVTSAALSKCMQIDGFTDASGIVYSYKYPSGSKYTYEVTCPITKTLRCDQQVLARKVVGDYNPREGEYTLPPSSVKASNACANSGFSFGHNDLSYVGLTYPRVVDDFTMVMTCSNKASLCNDVEPALGSPVLREAQSCFSADARSGLLKVNSGDAVSVEKVQAEVCGPLGFDSVQSMGTPRLEDQTGAFDFYSVKATCSNYQYNDTQPLMDSCAVPGDDNGAPVIDPSTCDVGNVTGTVQGSRDPFTGEYSGTPSNAEISSKLCKSNGYTSLDSVISMTQIGSAYDSPYTVTAKCSGYTGSALENCATETECFGEKLPNNTQEPYLEFEGQKYLNLCYEKADNPDDLCDDCLVGLFEFTDPVTGNTCSINTQSALSGEKDTVNFVNGSVNGVVDINCNNGVKRLEDGGQAKCYKTCPANATVTWNDKNGAASCSANTSAGNHVHNATLSLSRSSAHTGSAQVKCNGYTGQWEVQSSTCKLDCGGSSESWGSGTSLGGANKTNACSAPTSVVKHGARGTFTSTASATSGSVNYTCNDGEFTLSNPSCSLGCEAQRVKWGDGDRCQVNTGSMNPGVSGTYSNNNSLVGGFDYYTDISGASKVNM